MFRPMRRWKQQLSDAECIAILEKEPRGILSVLGDDGYPYGIPMNHWYCEADGKLYFHGAKQVTRLMPFPNATRFPTVSMTRAIGRTVSGRCISKCCSVRQDSAGERYRKGTGNLHAPLPEIY